MITDQVNINKDNNKELPSQTLFGNKYENIYQESIRNPDGFWAKAATLVSWYKPWKAVCDNSNEPFTQWFVDGKINACYNCIDRHIEAGHGSDIALIYDSPLTGIARKITYFELYDKVTKLAGLLVQCDVQKGDRVLIYMPLIPETVVAMLAVARIGAIHSLVFGGFAATELTTRIEHAEPKVIIAASCGIEPNKYVNYMENLNKAIDMCNHKPYKCIIYQRKAIYIAPLNPERDIDWIHGIENVDIRPECVPVDSNDPLYILYTSGTTGDPKGVQRPTGGHLTMLALTMSMFYGMKANDVWWATSDFGWVVGHSYMCYGPLLSRVTSIIYEGKPTTTPNPSSYYRIINDYKVKAMFTVPTALRVLKDADPEGNYSSEYDLSTLKNIWVAGEHMDKMAQQWTKKIFNVTPSNHWWQTEIGSPITGMCGGLINPCDDKNLTIGLPLSGFQIRIITSDGRIAKPNESGRIVCKLPLPPGVMSTLYKNYSRFYNLYFTKYPGYYDTMDLGYIGDDGLVYIISRADDIINVAGHRLSTMALEEVVLSHPDIAAACVVSVPDAIKTEVPLCLFVMRSDAIQDEYVIAQELREMVREHIGPVAAFKLAAAVKTLPTTISGKICRKSISDLARNQLKKIPSTVQDSSIYVEIEDILREMGFSK